MKDIAVFGAGGLGREVSLIINQLIERGEEWNFIGYFDDKHPKGERVSHLGYCLGGAEEVNTWSQDLDMVIAIGEPKSVKSVRERILNPRVNFPNIIAPEVTLADPETFSIGEGNILKGGTYVSCDVKIGDFNLLNGEVILGHDICIGNYNTIMPAVRISGEVTIGSENLLGIASIIIQRMKIGNRVHIGAGSVLMTKPKDNNTYIGNPARIFKY